MNSGGLFRQNTADLPGSRSTVCQSASQSPTDELEVSMSANVILLASAGPGGTTTYTGKHDGPSIGEWQAALVINPDQVANQAVLHALIARLQDEVAAQVARPQGMRHAGDVIGRRRGFSQQQFTNHGQESSRTFYFRGNASHSAAAICSARYQGPLIGVHGLGLVVNLEACANDAGITAAVNRVTNAVLDVAYP